MKLLRRCVVLALAAAVLAPAWGAKEMGPRQRRAAVEDADTGRVIVKYRADSLLMRPLSAQAAAPRAQHAAALGLRLGLPLVDGRELGARTQGLRSDGITSADLQRRLALQPEVEWVVIDRRRVALATVPNDPYFGPNQTSITPAVGQWYLRAPDASVVSATNAVGAWAVTQGSPAITVAVLDTGVRPDHEDLQGKLHPGYDFINDVPTAGDGNGRDGDASDPGDYTSASASCGASSSSWHGTQTAGIVGAATDNNVGMAGVGRNVMVLPVRVLGKCGGYDSDIIAGMRWAAGVTTTPTVNAHPAKVINMSLGSAGACESAYAEVFNELTAAGVSVVVAAGNETGHAVGTPANCPGAIAVGGLRHIGTKVGFSDVGPEITIAAPAGNCVNEAVGAPCLYAILTTTNAGSQTPTTNTYSDSFDYSVGTSFSSPMVAGAIGLMLSVDPTLSPAHVKAILQSTARAFPTSGAAADVQACHAPNSSDQIECYCTTSTCGAGMLNIAGAVTLPPQATPAASSSTPFAGESVTLTAESPTAFSGRTIVGYLWEITGGGTLAAFSGATNAATATLTTSAAGVVTLRLTLTDSAGVSSAKTTTVSVQAASGGGGGSGGGAMSAAWLAGLLAAVLALARSQRRA